jgi:hypothetical protein
MREQATTWDEVRRIADEIELKIHLAGMDARDRWRALQPRVVEIEKKISSAGNRIGAALDREVDSIGAALRRLRDEVSPPSKPS